MSTNKKTLYVGGLADDVDADLLRTNFSAFGDVIDVNLPIDFTTQKHKGYAFVEFQWPEDASDAIDNMDNGEILGKTIRVNIAKPVKYKDSTNKPIWADDEYLQKVGAGQDPSDEDGEEVDGDKAADEAR